VALYPVIWILDRALLLLLKFDSFKEHRRWWDRTLGFLWLAWILHWVPFFGFGGRCLYSHSYLPAFAFATMLAAGMVDFFARIFSQTSSGAQKATWMKMLGTKCVWAIALIVAICCTWSFVHFSPLTYGTDVGSMEDLLRRQWMDTYTFS
jgi:dolichyl-phosphate-mannose-protein mannosyltransferase